MAATPFSSTLRSLLEQEDDGEDYFIDIRRFSPGIMMIFTTYVATISASISDYRVAVLEQQEKTTYTIPQANHLILRAALETIGWFLLSVVVSAIIVTLLTDPLDERMLFIVNGVSRVVASVVLAILSVRVALWLDLYPSYRRVDSYKAKQRQKLMGRTAVQLKHAVRWSVAGNFLRPYCLLLFLFQEGADPLTIPMSIISGIATGLFVDFSIYTCRRFKRPKAAKRLSIIFVSVLCFFSAGAMAVGAYFIAEVWDDDAESAENSNWPGIVVLCAVTFLPLLHIVVWRYTKYVGKKIEPGSKSAHGEEQDDQETQEIRSSLSRHQRRMATSMFFSRMKMMENVDNNDEDEAMNNGNNVNDNLAAITEEKSGDTNDEHSELPNTVMGMTTANDDDNDVVNVDEDEEQKDEPEAPPKEQQDDDNDDEDDVQPPTRRELWMDWQCCGCVRGKEKPAVHKATSCAIWTGYLTFCFICLFNVIVNMGATYQQEWARDKLPFVFEEIYRYIDEGPVCAYNGTKYGEMATFPNEAAAEDAGFLILHCGACAACSDWHNLELEYTTREFLALESRKCAQKSLFGSGADDLAECLGEPQIGFQGECAVCWAEDILCTKKYCSFIAIQSFMINTLSNFEVGEDTITAAACEEAHCEAGNPGDFVFCSGATRRRMNVTSSIKRPGAQQCSIVDVKWEELFPDPHPNA